MANKTIRLEFYLRCPGCNYVSYGEETSTMARDYPRACPNCDMQMMPELRVHEDVNGERNE